MAYRRLPNTVSAVIRALQAARDTAAITPASEHAISAAQLAQIVETDPDNILNRLLKESSEADIALAMQAPLTSRVNQVGARLTMFCTHFHRVLDFAIARGVYDPALRILLGRDASSTTVPDLSTQYAVEKAAETIVEVEAERAKGTSKGHDIPMTNPSAADIAPILAEYRTLRIQSQQAQSRTNDERADVQRVYPEAHALAVDIYDTVEFHYRKELTPSSFRARCRRWGVVYIYEANEPADEGDTKTADAGAAPAAGGGVA